MCICSRCVVCVACCRSVTIRNTWDVSRGKCWRMQLTRLMLPTWWCSWNITLDFPTQKLTFTTFFRRCVCVCCVKISLVRVWLVFFWVLLSLFIGFIFTKTWWQENDSGHDFGFFHVIRCRKSNRNFIQNEKNIFCFCLVKTNLIHSMFFISHIQMFIVHNGVT